MNSTTTLYDNSTLVAKQEELYSSSEFYESHWLCQGFNFY